MAQTVDVGGFAHTALLDSTTQGPLQSAGRDRAAVMLDAVRKSLAGHRREQPVRGAVGAPEFSELGESFVWQGHQPIVTAFAVDVQEHPRGIDLGDGQAAAFIQTQATDINGGQTDPVNGFAHTGQDLSDFLPAQDHGQFLLSGRTQEFEGGPISLEGILEEELDAAQRDGSGGPSDFAFQGQMEEVTPQFLLSDEVRGFAAVPGQADHGADLTGLGFRRITVELHILDETST